MKKLFLAFALGAALTFCTGADGHPPSGSKLVTETYIVKSWDTLWSISDMFMEKNSYGPRDIREFYHGIIELNYDSVFQDRPQREIHPGDTLKINYWVKE